jgi:hypothetical protein
MTVAAESKARETGSASAGGGGDTYSDAALHAVREVGFAPLVSGFVQGFATVAIAHWRERRNKARAAADAAATAAPRSPVSGDADGLAPVFIAPQ